MAHAATPDTAGRWIHRPPSTADPATTTRHRSVGLVLAVLGLALVTVGFVANLVAAGDLAGGDVTDTLSWTFATSVTGFGLAKLGIAVTLVGIVIRLWHRANSLTASLPELRSGTLEPTPTGTVETTSTFGRARTTAHAPPPLLIHRVARAVWLPVLAMGAMALAVGLVLGLATANADAGSESFLRLSAWTQGTLFLGEGLLLSGISFLLGTILASLRQAGGEVQQSLGLPVQTLRMPTTAKGFIGLMALGMMMAIAQFVLYAVAATRAVDPSSFAVWATWLGPFRETALGLLLAGIVLALFAISRVLGFQFRRIRHIITT